MENQGQNITNRAGQAQMQRDGLVNQPSNTQNPGQGNNFLQQTGDSVKNMAQGATTIAHGAVQGAANVAQGAALGAANIAQGAADAVKNTLGVNSPDNSSNRTTNTNTNCPTNQTTNNKQPSYLD